MRVTFSVDLRDRDGDVYDKCILLHCGDQVILRFSTIGEMEVFAKSVLHMRTEIRESYPGHA